MVENFKNYWKIQSKLILWKKKPKNIFDKNLFYNDGKINIAYNCIRLNINKKLGNKTAIVFLDKNENQSSLSFQELENLVDNFIVFLNKNFKKKDLRSNIVAIHSSANICSAISMLAFMKLGITHSVIFNDLSEEAIKIRLKLLKSKIIISSANNNDFNNKILNIKNIKKIKFSEDDISNNKIVSITFSDLMKYKKKKIENIKYNFVNSNKASFVLFTSGTTGQPKGIIHSTGGYLTYSKYTCIKQFGMNRNSIILTASDAGWINGHTYALYGPLSVGAKTILLEKPLSLLSFEFLFKILNHHKVTILYLPVTLIRMIKAINFKSKYNSKYLKTLGSMGEPLSNYIGKWFSSAFSKKKLQVVNTYFQTETGGIIASPRYNDSIKSVPYGSVGKPINKFLDLIIEKKNNRKPEIKIKNPWPGCLIGVINGKKFFKKYWDKNNFFKLFDVGSFDSKKNLIIHGRSDDVINIRGHRIGSAEIETVVSKLNEIHECCAVGVKDELEGHVLVVFYKSKNQKKLDDKIKNILIKNFGIFSIPKQSIELPGLPKTRSGKILRRLMRELFENPMKKDLGDLSTILNKNLINLIRDRITKTQFKS